jgi:hypothetical protein
MNPIRRAARLLLSPFTQNRRAESPEDLARRRRVRMNLETLEDRVTPDAVPALYALGADVGELPKATVYDAETGQ